MGEIFKDPKNAVNAVRKDTNLNIESSRVILDLYLPLLRLLRFYGISQTIRILQYALEDLASSINPQNREDKETAARYSQAAETLEKPYQELKHDEIKIIYDTE